MADIDLKNLGPVFNQPPNETIQVISIGPLEVKSPDANVSVVKK